MKNKCLLIVLLTTASFLNLIGQDTLYGDLQNSYIKWILQQSPDRFEKIQFFDFDNHFNFSNKRSLDLQYLALPSKYRINFTGLSYPTNQLIVKPNGTSRLYCIYYDSLKHKVLINRIDKTLYTGYNFYEFIFQRTDTIFALGGQGFWTFNGQLRYFVDKKGEWEVKPISQWFPVSDIDDLVDMRINEGEVYTFFHNKLPKYFSKPANHPVDSIVKLNLINGEVKVLGKVNAGIDYFNSDKSVRVQTNYGLLILENSKLRLLDFKKNQSLVWENIGINNNLYNSSEAKRVSFILSDSTIYYFQNHKIDSIRIPFNSFRFVSKIYIPIEEYSNQQLFNSIYIIIPISFILVIIIYVRRNKYIKKNNITSPTSVLLEDMPKTIEIEKIFEDRELDLIKMIIESQNMIDVENMNTILGVQRKSFEVQKRRRSQVISTINIKFKKEVKINNDLIIRKKNENDARTIIYQVDARFLYLFNK
jgi:hypothetical protein